MKRYVKLFERYVRENEEIDQFGDSEYMPNNDMPSEDMSKDEIIKNIAEWLKSNVLADITTKEESILKELSNNVAPEINEHYLSESLGNRMSKFKERAMIGGGLSTLATGFVGFVSQITGWSQTEIMTGLHEYFQSFGGAEYTGPITVAMIAAGLTLALKGYSDRAKRLDTPYTKDKSGNGFNSY